MPRAAALDTAKDLILRVEAAIATLGGEIASANGASANQVNRLETQINQLANSVLGPVNAQGAALDTAKDLILRVETAIATLGGEIASANGASANQVNRLETQINQLANSVLGPVNAQGAALDTAKDLILRVETAIATLGGAIAGTNGASAKQINLLETQINQLANSVLGPVNAQGAALDTAKDLILRAEAAIATLGGEIASANGASARQFNLFETQINQLANDVLAPVNAQAAMIDTAKDLILRVEKAIAALGNRLATVNSSSANQANLLETRINQLENKVLGPVNAQGASLEAVKHLILRGESQLAALQGHVADANGALANQLNTLETTVNRGENAVLGPITGYGKSLETIRDLVLRVETALAASEQRSASGTGSLNEKLGSVEMELNQTRNAILGPVNAQAAMLDSLTGLVLRVEQALAGTENRISSASNAVANRVNAVENLLQSTRQSDEHLQQLTSRGIASLISRFREPVHPKVAVARPGRVIPVDEQIAGFRRAAPLNVDAWLQTFKAGTRAGADTAAGTLSHEGHIGATYFRMFVNVHGRGRLLDAGLRFARGAPILGRLANRSTGGLRPDRREKPSVSVCAVLRRDDPVAEWQLRHRCGRNVAGSRFPARQGACGNRARAGPARSAAAVDGNV